MCTRWRRRAFFFQATDGIRDRNGTGVQTCALPILPVREYKTADARHKDVTRQALLGDGTGEEPFTFVTRYFEIQPGGYSTLERHQHPHAVVVLRGRGR